ncbi:hypothetical protein CAC42_3303 [Sphaceloma murrayae]|uniref:Uncharacterized protein n=1 Tax=Sphaceloma murrayae TaxID=2082308 RepID=A0A2K1QG09_9PEZI|nr:hypothetical protein CAC42_3303 [Sphaceloma murrayae]
MAEAAAPIYFETAWSILSSVGICQVIFGGLVISNNSVSGLSILPVIIGTAAAIANGMCYQAFYADYALNPRLIGSGIADIMWLIQEAGLSFYSYQILLRILRNKAKIIFVVLFWAIMVPIVSFRMCILVYRIQDLKDGSSIRQKTINNLHMGYFICIALCEVVSSTFLLRQFVRAHSNAKTLFSTSAITGQLIRSTETRVGTLALIGVTRAVTYSFQQNAQSASSVASQLDRFVYTLETMFPFVMIIDLLASRLVGQGGGYGHGNSKSGGGPHGKTIKTATATVHGDDVEMHLQEDERGIIRQQEIIIHESSSGDLGGLKL